MGFKAALRRHRLQRNMTQSALAKAARVGQPYVSDLESGEKRSPSMSVLVRLAKALGVTVADLVK